MRYVAAYCLFALSGKSPSAKDLEKLLGSVGVDCDAEQAKKVVSELEGKDLEELIKNGELFIIIFIIIIILIFVCGCISSLVSTGYHSY